METRLLKAFCAVADSGHLTAAARKVHLTSSAISHSIRSLETELGCRLFERVGKRLALNQAGEQLLAQVRGPLEALDSAAEGIRHLGKWGRTRLRVGASETACEHILPGVIRELRRHFPSLELRVESGDTPELIDLLQQSKVEVALGPTPAYTAGLSMRPAFRDELMFVFAAEHAWADGRAITREEIRDQHFILCHGSSTATHLLTRHFRQLQIQPGVTMEVGSAGAIIELVKLNLGVAVMAPWTANRELAQGILKMRPLAARPVSRRWSILSLASHRMSLAEETFCRVCGTQATGMRLDRHDLPLFKPIRFSNAVGAGNGSGRSDRI